MGALIPYFGGKTRLAKQIIDRFPEHTCYVEVFAGGAAVFFKKPPSVAEVLNDLDFDLVNLYRAVKHHPEELYRQFKFSLVARVEFERETRVAADTLTDIQRAARYLYLQKSAFGGHIVSQTYGTATTRHPRLNLLTLQTTLEESWQRLSQVNIECLDFRRLIPKYDRQHTLFYLDPPYWDIPGYKHDFSEQDFIDLSEILTGLKGRFLMSINDTTEIRSFFSQFYIDQVELKYSMSTSKKSRSTTRTELLISNYRSEAG